jgi:hypothetical protein
MYRPEGQALIEDAEARDSAFPPFVCRIGHHHGLPNSF